MSVLNQSIGEATRSSEHGCVGCDNEAVDQQRVVLDGEKTVSLWLCRRCYDQCYKKILRADWIEEVE